MLASLSSVYLSKGQRSPGKDVFVPFGADIPKDLILYGEIMLHFAGVTWFSEALPLDL